MSEKEDKHPHGDVTSHIELTEVVAAPPPGNSFAGPRSNVDMVYNKPLAEVVFNYISYYANGESHTARAKRYDLNYFLDFLVERLSRSGEVLVRDWTLQATKDYIAHRLASGESPATVSRRLATLKHMGRTLAERIPGFINPAREARGPVLSISRPQGLSNEEIDLLRQAARDGDSDDFISVRNQTILEVLLSTGLRADEVRTLTVGQLAANLSWLHDVQTKGKKFRNVYLEEGLKPLLLRYLESRRETLTSATPGVFSLAENEQKKLPLFISLKGAIPIKPRTFTMAPKTLWRIIFSFGKLAQALSPTPVSALHPHLLRHTFAHGLLDSSRDIRLVAQALGHSDVRTTMRYTERSEEEVARAIEKKSLETLSLNKSRR